MVARTRLNVTLYVHWLSCYISDRLCLVLKGPSSEGSWKGHFQENGKVYWHFGLEKFGEFGVIRFLTEAPPHEHEWGRRFIVARVVVVSADFVVCSVIPWSEQRQVNYGSSHWSRSGHSGEYTKVFTLLGFQTQPSRLGSSQHRPR